MTEKTRRKNAIITAAILLVMIISGVSAYFTSYDEAENITTVGEIDINLTESDWVPPLIITPNQEIKKNPVIWNNGKNAAYVFAKVTVPKKNIVTSDTSSGTRKSAAVTQLFQLNADYDSASSRKWTGLDTHNASWQLISSDTSGSDRNVYVYAYGTAKACTALSAGSATAEAVFDSVTFCNAIEGEGLEGSSQSIIVEAFGIQTANLTSDDKSAPADVWAILNTQSGNGSNTGTKYNHSGTAESVSGQSGEAGE